MLHPSRSRAPLVVLSLLLTTSMPHVANSAAPPTPGGFSVGCAFTTCILDWGSPSGLYKNHSHTVIYRSTAPARSGAVEIGRSDWMVFTDANVEAGTRYYYWIRFESTEGVRGPFAGPESDRTAVDIDAFHDNLLRDLENDPFAQSLREPITTPEHVTEEIRRVNEEIDRINEEIRRMVEAIGHDPEPVEVEEYHCTDEHEQALALTTVDNYFDTAVPALWDGTPFIVDVSSALPSADDLLDAVAEEAARIHAALGYRIFVAGDVLPLADLTVTPLIRFDPGRPLVPPNQHIEIRCCHNSGAAAPWYRMILLSPDDDGYQARFAIIHELYHILGFAHPGATPGVEMSRSLDSGDGSVFTRSAPIDLARLACIYD